MNYEIELGHFEYVKSFFDTESEEYWDAKDNVIRAEDEMRSRKEELAHLRNRVAEQDAMREVARAQ